jgi:hypothetical protein
MADIYTMTPGSQVAETVQGLLQRKREMERQAMLDMLGVEKFRLDEESTKHGMRMDEGRLSNDTVSTNANVDQSRAAVRASDANVRQSDASVDESRTRRQGAMLEQLPDMPVADPSSLDPELQELMLSRGRATPADPTFKHESPGEEASPRGEVGAIDQALKANITDQGGPEFQKEQDQRNRTNEFITNNEGIFKDNDELRTALGIRAAGVPTQGIPASLFEPPPSVTPIGPDGSIKPTITGRRGTSFMELPYPPQTNAANAPTLYQIDDNNDGVFDRSDFLTPEQGRAVTATGARIDKGDAPADPSLGLVARSATALGNTLRMPRSRQRDAAIVQQKQAVIAAANLPIEATAEVQTVLDAFVQRAEQGLPMPTPEQMQSAVSTKFSKLNPQQQARIYNVINLVVNNLRVQ